MRTEQAYNISFGNITKTRELFETMLLRTFKSYGTDAIKTVRNDLYPNSKFVGCKGYRYYAEEIRNKVIEKYPQIASDYKEISNFIKANPQMDKKSLENIVEPYIQKYGETIDITI